MANQEAQCRYEYQYDKSSTTPSYKIGDWVFVYFPSEETGKLRKLSLPWHGPYRVISRDDPDVTVTKVYFPDDPPLQITVLFYFLVAIIGTARSDLDPDGLQSA